jgi:SNF2 family DNA or RNA helicase
MKEKKSHQDLERNSLNGVSSASSEGIEAEVPHRCLIFAQHRQTLDVIESCVLKRYFPDINYARLDGSVAPVLRAKTAVKFNMQQQSDDYKRKEQGQRLIGDMDGLEGPDASTSMDLQGRKGGHQPISLDQDDDLRILLMTTRACGLGLNLTAADTVIL